MKRYVSIWFRYLVTDWFACKQKDLHNEPLVLSKPTHGRLVVTAVNTLAEQKGIYAGMSLADARAIHPGILVKDDVEGLQEKLLKNIAEWCIRFTPFASVNLPDGVILDATGCAHLWGGELLYVSDIVDRFKNRGFHVRAAMADTVGTAWAVARFGNNLVVDEGQNMEALLKLPPAALRIDDEVTDKLNKLGLFKIGSFINMPRAALTRRFGNNIIKRLNQAIGIEDENLEPVIPIVPYQERLPCLEPIVTATGIEIALKQLLETLCTRMVKEHKGLRTACLKGFRIDGKIEQVSIATVRASCNVQHLFKLFELKLQTIEPALGIELFLLEASGVEDHQAVQEKLWENSGGLENIEVAELIDRIAGKIGLQNIRRYLPAEHYWPERSIKIAASLQEQPTTEWTLKRPRPINILSAPEQIDVTAPVPDYPPMLFRYKGKLHKIARADGPERIEQEWWIQEGQHRDYYTVEDDEGMRYWLFRSGHYDEEYKWYVHGFFA